MNEEDKIINTNEEESDISFVEEDENNDPKLLVKKLREKLKNCEKERTEFLDGWQRSKADYINANKALNDAKTSLLNFAESGLIEDLLPVLDSFYAARINKVAWEATPKEWRLGIEYIEQQLKNVLTGRGLTILIPENEMFNHEIHEAVGEEGGESGKIISVRQPGYQFKGKLIRSARVIVGK